MRLSVPMVRLNVAHYAVAVIWGINLYFSVALADTKIKIVTLEWEPFIGRMLPEQGYTAELITAAFESSGYTTEIEFVTLARGRKLMEQGVVHGYITPYGHIREAQNSLLSNVFYGDSIGLLKSKSLALNFQHASAIKFDDYISKLNDYRFGVLKGGVITKRFDSLPAENVHYAMNDLENIDLLSRGEVDFIVIGKFSAAELITNKRPHLIGRFEFMQTEESNNGFRLAFSKKNKHHIEIQSAFNKGLDIIKKNGVLARLNNKHGMYPPKRENNESITIGTVNNRDMIVLKELSSRFEKENPDIKIEWQIYDENVLRRRTLSDLAISDGQFDIVTVGLQEIPSWSKNSWLTALKRIPDSYEVTDIFQSLVEAHSFNGELYALPFYAESSVTYYRRDLFADAGLSIKQHPTYNDIVEYAKAIHNPDEGVYGICLRGKVGWGESLGLITTMVNTYGGKWFDMNWKPQFNTVEWKNALTMYSHLLLNYGPPEPWLNGYNESLAMFLKGKCGLWIDATIASNSIFDHELSSVSEVTGVVKAPVAKTPTGSNWLWAWSFAVSAQSSNAAKAEKFITWATSKSYIELVRITKGESLVPQGTRYSTYNSEPYRKSMPYVDVLLSAMTDASKQNSALNKPYKGIQFVEISEFPAMGNAISLFMVEMLKGNISTELALKKAQNYTTLQMKLSGYYKH